MWLGRSTSFFELRSNGSVLACGENSKGELGLGDTNDRAELALFGKSNVKEIRNGLYTTCIMDNANSVQCAGGGRLGELGRGAFGDSLDFASVLDPTLSPTAPTTSFPTIAVPSTAAPTTEESLPPAAGQDDNDFIVLTVVVPLVLLATLLAAGLGVKHYRRRSQRADVVVPKLTATDIAPFNRAASLVEVHPSRENSRNTSNNVPPQAIMA